MLTSEDFAAAIIRYIDEEKPDKIREKQIQSWEFQWIDPPPPDDDTETRAFALDHMIRGTVRWMGEYIGIDMESTCYWKGDESIVASCTAKAFARTDIDDTKSKKRQTKLLKRMKQDEAVCKLFECTDAALELYDASIFSSEERVCWNEPTCRAIQQSIYGAAESPLEVFEFICSLPILPGTAHTSLHTVTKLADRLKLRLLEDATYDACEAEDSDAATTVEDLSLDDNDNAKGDADGAKRQKRS